MGTKHIPRQLVLYSSTKENVEEMEGLTKLRVFLTQA